MKKKIVIIGASGMVGKKVNEAFSNENFDIIRASKNGDEHQVDMENAENIQAAPSMHWFAQPAAFHWRHCHSLRTQTGTSTCKAN